jgi:hypothetical protein
MSMSIATAALSFEGNADQESGDGRELVISADKIGFGENGIDCRQAFYNLVVGRTKADS